MVRAIPLLKNLIEVSESTSGTIPIQTSTFTFLFVKDYIDLGLKTTKELQRFSEQIDFRNIQKVLTQKEVMYLLNVLTLQKHQEFYTFDRADRSTYIYFDNYDHTGPLKVKSERVYKNLIKKGIYYRRDYDQKPYEVIRPDVIEKKLEPLGCFQKINYIRGMKELCKLANTADFLLMHDLLNLVCVFIGYLIFDLSVKQKNILIPNDLSATAKRKICNFLKPTEHIPYFPDKFFSKKTRLGAITDFGECEKLLTHAFNTQKASTEKILEDAVKNGRYDFLVYAKSKGVAFGINLIYIACRKGDLACLKYLYTACKGEEYALSCMPSVEGGDLNCFKFMLEKNYTTSSLDACNFCIADGKVDFLKHAVSKGCSLIRDDIRIAVSRNALDCLKYIVKVFKNPTNSFMIEMIDNASYNGSFECMKYLIETQGYSFNADLIKKNSIRQGRLKCLEYIHEVLNSDFNENDLLESIRTRHFDVTKYIAEKFDIEENKFKDEAINYQNISFLKMCKFLNVSHANHAFIYCKLHSINFLAKKGIFPDEHIIWESLEHVDSSVYMKTFLENGFQLSDRILRVYVVGGHTDLLKISGVSLEKIATIAAKCGSVKCLRFVKSLKPIIDKKKLLENAKNGCKWFIRSQF